MMLLPTVALIPSSWLSTLTMLALVSVLVIAHELGHFWVARKCGIKVERFGLGLPFGPVLYSKTIGGVEFLIHAALFGGYVAFPDDNPDSPVPKESKERFENQGWWQRFAVAIAGITVNAIMGWAIMVWVVMQWGLPQVNAVQVVDFAAQNSPAQLAGFQPNDRIERVGTFEIAQEPGQMKVSRVITTIRQSPGKPLAIQVARGPEKTPQRLTLTVTPNAKGQIGVHLQPVSHGFKRYTNVWEATVVSHHFLWDYILKNFEGLGWMLTGKISPAELSGPVRIIEEGGRMIEESGFQNGLILTAIISVILAVMNLLPIPALDGGHILFLLVEAVKGSPVKKSIQDGFTQAGFVVLMLFMGFVLINDVFHLFRLH
ncbi:MAG: RIP metalloprotease RseP [Vampirovibrionales bacterium]